MGFNFCLKGVGGKKGPVPTSPGERGKEENLAQHLLHEESAKKLGDVNP